MATVRIFLIYDVDNDGDLHDQLLAQSRSGGSPFEITGHSQGGATTDRWDATVRSRISAADEIVVICGEHTDACVRVSAELRIAQEEQKPYLLLWGRRESMCTRPVGARPADSMYSWTPEILENQIAVTLRKSKPLEVPESCKRASTATS